MSFWSDHSTEVMYIWKREMQILTHRRKAQVFNKAPEKRAYFALLLVHHPNQTDTDGIALRLHDDTAETTCVE